MECAAVRAQGEIQWEKEIQPYDLSNVKLQQCADTACTFVRCCYAMSPATATYRSLSHCCVCVAYVYIPAHAIHAEGKPLVTTHRTRHGVKLSHRVVNTSNRPLSYQLPHPPASNLPRSAILHLHNRCLCLVATVLYCYHGDSLIVLYS